MPNGNAESDSTDSDYPSRADQPFQGRKSEAEAQANGEQRGGSDSTGEESAEPATSASGPSTQEGAPTRGSDADSTTAEPTDGDEAPQNGEVTGAARENGEAQAEREDTGTDAPQDASEEDPAGEPAPEEGGEAEPTGEDPSEDGAQEERPFQYHGTEPEDEEYEDFVFISEVDPDQRYETVEDLVNGVENHIEHVNRQNQRVERLQSRLTEVQSEMEGEVAELKAENALYRDRLGDEELVDMIAENHMPEKFQGLREDEVSEAEREEYLEARGAAKQKAREDLQEMEETREERQERARERRENIESRVEEATEFLDRIDTEALGLDDAENGEAIAAEAVSRLTNGDPEDGGMTPMDLAHTIYYLPDMLPEEINFSHEDAETAAELVAINAVRDEARRIREERRSSRADKIRRMGSRRGEENGEAQPEKATETSSGREPKMTGNPFR